MTSVTFASSSGSVENLNVPALLLARKNFPPDRPVQLDQLGIDRALDLDLGLVDTLLERIEYLVITVGKSNVCRSHEPHCPLRPLRCRRLRVVFRVEIRCSRG